MAKKTEPLQKEPVGPHSKKYKVKVRASETFTDGNLFQFFGELGYTGEWPKNEVREIPPWLYKRCLQSGGEFEPVDG